MRTDNIDLLVNNAGVMGEREGWRKCIDINMVRSLTGIRTLDLDWHVL
jgi:hypothetical protein